MVVAGAANRAVAATAQKTPRERSDSLAGSTFVGGVSRRALSGTALVIDASLRNGSNNSSAKA